MKNTTNTRHGPVAKFRSILLFISSVFFLFVFSGAVDFKDHNPPDPECRTPFKKNIVDIEDNGCDYPSQVYDIIKAEVDFEDWETRFIYIKVTGADVMCGEVLIQPKSGEDCFYDTKITGPQWYCLSDEQSNTLDEIGEWDPDVCTEFSECDPELPTSFDVGGNIIEFHGYEMEGNESYWYYEITSRAPQSISYVAFGLVCPSGMIGDFVWDDLDSDGDQDNEQGINGVRVALYDGDMNFIKDMLTKPNPNNVNREGSYRTINDNNDGYYMFTGLPAGDYYVTFVCPDGHKISPGHNCGNDEDIDSDIMGEMEPGIGITEMITLKSSEANITIDAGFYLAPLPVRFGDFTVNNVRNQIELTWTTLSEINNVGFYIEKSTGNDTEFREIGFVQGKGNSNGLVEYSYADLNFGRSTMLAYRLRQIDIDGNESYSAIRMIRTPGMDDYEVFPNPTTGVISVILPESSTVNHISIYNTIGQVIYSVNVNQATKSYQFDLGEFEEGIYLMRLENGINSKIKKIILNY